MEAIQINPDGRVTIDASGRAIVADPALGPGQACCCATSTCDSFRPALPRCAPVGSCGSGVVYLCTEIVTNLGRTIEEMVQGVGGPPGSGAGRYIRLDGACYRIDNTAGSPITRAQVDESVITCPGRVVTTATVIEMGLVDPGPEECAECGCCDVVTLFPEDCAFASDGACTECSNEFTYEWGVTASMVQTMTAAGLDLFYPPPTARPPGGVAYRATITWTATGRKVCNDGVPGYECYSKLLSIRQETWDQALNGGAGGYRVNTIESNGCDAPWSGIPQCGQDSAGRGRFGGLTAYNALLNIEIGSMLIDRPIGGGPALLEECSGSGPEIDREFATGPMPNQGAYSRHRQRYTNIASGMFSSCSGLATEEYYTDYTFGAGNHQHVWTTSANWSASRRFDETQPCDDNGPRCDSRGVRREASRRGAMSAERAVRTFSSTAEMLRAMGG